MSLILSRVRQGDGKRGIYRDLSGIAFIAEQSRDCPVRAAVLGLAANFVVRAQHMEIQLNFVNRSGDGGNSRIVIFQKNVVSEGAAVAWRVLDLPGDGGPCPLSFPTELSAAASDSHGNSVAPEAAEPGHGFYLTATPAGGLFAAPVPASSPTQIQVRNGLPRAIDARTYRGGRLLAAVSGLHPQQVAAFEFRPAIWIGAAPQVAEGEWIDGAIGTEVSLRGVARADLVMTGGGAKPLAFALENVVPI
jgi:hypothetical protein